MCDCEPFPHWWWVSVWTNLVRSTVKSIVKHWLYLQYTDHCLSRHLPLTLLLSWFPSQAPVILLVFHYSGPLEGLSTWPYTLLHVSNSSLPLVSCIQSHWLSSSFEHLISSVPYKTTGIALIMLGNWPRLAAPHPSSKPNCCRCRGTFPEQLSQAGLQFYHSTLSAFSQTCGFTGYMPLIVWLYKNGRDYIPSAWYVLGTRWALIFVKRTNKKKEEKEEEGEEYLKNFKSSNIQDSNERCSLTFGPVQSFIDAMNEPAKEPLVGSFCQCFYCKICLQLNHNSLSFWKPSRQSINSCFMEFSVIQHSKKLR